MPNRFNNLSSGNQPSTRLVDLYRSKAKKLKVEQWQPSLVEHLPAMYHSQAGESGSPLWTLLNLIETNFQVFQEILDEIEKYFDVWRAPAGDFGNEPDFLSWLGTWVGLVPESQWRTYKKRRVVARATYLHSLKGTVKGLKEWIKEYFQVEVEVKEWQWGEGMQIGVTNSIGIDTRLDIYHDINFCFKVEWEPEPDEFRNHDFKQRVIDIRAMIDHVKPVHTWCYFEIIGLTPELAQNLNLNC